MNKAAEYANQLIEIMDYYADHKKEMGKIWSNTSLTELLTWLRERAGKENNA